MRAYSIISQAVRPPAVEALLGMDACGWWWGGEPSIIAYSYDGLSIDRRLANPPNSRRQISGSHGMDGCGWR